MSATLPITHPTAHILHVDDHEVSRYTVSRTLQHANFVVSEAATGAEALRLVLSTQPDLVLLDVNLPDIHGFEVCRRIKADPATARIPVLHMSASYTTGTAVAEGLEGGADSYLVEPVDPKLLVATIRAMLRTREAEERASFVARQWQTTFDAITDGIGLLDREGRLAHCNRALVDLFQKPADQIIGKLCYELWDPPVERECAPFVRMLETGKREEVEVRRGENWYHVSVHPITDGKLEGAVFLVAEITARKQLDEQVRESQKFESLGHLAGGIAHDFNNLLTSILGNASLALMDISEPSVREKLQDVLKASERASDLTRQLLAYAGQGRFVLQRIDVAETVQSMRELIEAAIPRKVELLLELAPNLPPVMADGRQLQQVIMNLVLNASEAIGEQVGTIRIASYARQVAAGEIPNLEEGPHVCLEVQDTGCGIDDQTKAQIFDPFFTTKFTGRGLGLSAVSGIARGHKGSVQVDSIPGVGSTFRFYLPAVAAIPSGTEVVRPAASRGGSSTILVVDDEEMIRRIARTMLEMHGYKVLLAENGRQAVQVVRDAGSEISLMLLDMTMPVMDGVEALERIYQIRPGLRVIVSTGYDQQDALHRFARQRIHGFLQKPYNSRQLADKIQQALENR